MGSAGSPRLGQSNTARSVAERSRSIQLRSHSSVGLELSAELDGAGAAVGGTQLASATVEARRPTSAKKSRREPASERVLITISVTDVVWAYGGCHRGLMPELGRLSIDVRICWPVHRAHARVMLGQSPEYFNRKQSRLMPMSSSTWLERVVGGTVNAESGWWTRVHQGWMGLLSAVIGSRGKRRTHAGSSSTAHQGGMR
jgi:hypothetical protein